MITTYKKLGTYRPSVYDKDVIRERLISIFKNVGIPIDFCEVRFGTENAYIAKGDRSGSNWHKDGPVGHTDYVGIWCNKFPTDVRYAKTKRIVQIQPYEVVLLNNHAMRHRFPPRFAKRFRTAGLDKRWFAVLRTPYPHK